MPDIPRPRTFKEVVAAEDPAERARIEKSERFDDVTVGNPFHREVSVLEDRDGTGEWRVEYFDSDGGCYITVFAGPKAEGVHATISTRLDLDGYGPSETKGETPDSHARSMK